VVVTSSNQVEIANIVFLNCATKTVQLLSAYKTLVHRCSFVSFNIGPYVTDANPDGNGHAAFARAVLWGSTNYPVIEDCYFSNPPTAFSSAMDSEQGGMFVFRHNYVLNSKLDNHGTETGAQTRGARGFEIYNNTFVAPTAATTAFQIRAGTGMVFSNTLTGYTSFADLAVYRAMETFFPWDPSDGHHHMDNVIGTNYASGVATVTANYLQVAGTPWTINQWFGYTVVNKDWTGVLANYNFQLITSNSANQVFFTTGHHSQVFPDLTFTNGNHYEINYIYPFTDQPGRGQGDLLAIGDPTIGYPSNTVTHLSQDWPRQANEMIFFSSNTIDGALANAGSRYSAIQDGRDFTNNVPRPGYTPLVYPYPLQ
jgi:hypothetical protein